MKPTIKDLPTTNDLPNLIKVAEQGDAEAQYQLARMYNKGEGVTRDYGQAVAWCRKAAEQGHEEAQFGLGVMYNEGRGVTRDYEAAYGWYARSAAHAQGNVVATLALDELEKKLTPEQIARVQKMLSEQAKAAPKTP